MSFEYVTKAVQDADRTPRTPLSRSLVSLTITLCVSLSATSTQLSDFV